MGHARCNQLSSKLNVFLKKVKGLVDLHSHLGVYALPELSGACSDRIISQITNGGFCRSFGWKL